MPPEKLPLEGVSHTALVNKATLDKLRHEILSHIDARHQELRNLQEGLFDKLRAEIHCAVSEVVVDEQLPQQQRVPATAHQQSASSTSPDDVKTSIASTPATKPHSVALAPTVNNGLKESSHRGQPRGQFEGRPDLLAFLETKNWDSDAAQEPDVECHEEVKEKDSSHPLWQKFKLAIYSTAFEMIIAKIILVNALVMGMQLEYEGMQSADAIGITPDEGNWPNAAEAFDKLEHVFAIIFLLELVCRVLVMGYTYFKHFLNWLDVVVVVCSMLELYILPRIGAKMPNMTFIRLLRYQRLFKVVRVLRMVRMLKFFEDLRVLVVAVSYSMSALVWSMLLLGLVQLIAAIFMTQSLQPYLQDRNADPQDRATIYLYFGSFSRSIITLFEMTLAIGSWSKCGRIIVFSVSRYYAIFFLGYLSLVSFAMIRVIGALFLKDTLASAAKDNESVMAHTHKDPQFIKSIWTEFHHWDANSDGFVSGHELSDALESEAVCKRLSKLGIIPHELKGLFKLMDDGDDEISFSEFLTGIMRLKIASKGVDLATLLYENKKLLKRVLDVRSTVGDIGRQVDGLQQSLGGQVDVLRKDLGHCRLALTDLRKSSGSPNHQSSPPITMNSNKLEL